MFKKWWMPQHSIIVKELWTMGVCDIKRYNSYCDGGSCPNSNRKKLEDVPKRKYRKKHEGRR